MGLLRSLTQSRGSPTRGPIVSREYSSGEPITESSPDTSRGFQIGLHPHHPAMEPRANVLADKLWRGGQPRIGTRSAPLLFVCALAFGQHPAPDDSKQGHMSWQGGSRKKGLMSRESVIHPRSDQRGAHQPF